MDIQFIQKKIYLIRNQRVMLDFHIAELYGIETKRLKEAVKRNINRFPNDFMFELTKNEYESLRTQFATSKRGGSRYLPFAFTEHGILMLSSVLNSEKAIEVNINIMRTFVLIRNYALTYQELSERLKNLEGNYSDVYEALNYLMKKDKISKIQIDRKQIGY